MNAQTHTSTPKGTDWSAVTEDEWKAGYAAVAAARGVSKQAAANAHARILRRGSTAAHNGRPKLAPPAGLDKTRSAKAIAAEYGVSVGTAYTWLKA